MAKQNTTKKWIFLAVFVLLVILTFYLLQNILGALIVGALIAYFNYPLYTRVCAKVKSKTCAGILLSMGSIFALILILALIVPSLISQTYHLYETSESMVGNLAEELSQCENGETFKCKVAGQVKALLDAPDFQQQTMDVLKKTSLFFAQSITDVIGSVIAAIISLVVILFSVFYFLDHGKDIKNTILELIPLDKKHKKQIYQQGYLPIWAI